MPARGVIQKLTSAKTPLPRQVETANRQIDHLVYGL
jgi:hypothetical protein